MLINQTAADAVLELLQEVIATCQIAGQDFSNDRVGFLATLAAGVNVEDTIARLKSIITQELRRYEYAASYQPLGNMPRE